MTHPERWHIHTWTTPQGHQASGVRCGHCGFIAVANPVHLHEQICQTTVGVTKPTGGTPS